MIKYVKNGFTLVELMVALAVSSFLMAGISYVYIAISQSVDTSKELENAQEVLRYSSEVFTRSLKQTKTIPTTPNANTIVVEQATSGATACNSTKPAVPFIETFTLIDSQLRCQVNAADEQVLLTGLQDISYRINGNLVEITLVPENLYVDMLANGFRIDIALSGKILEEALN
ncbi:prepilin-type N-terminal cleavage/methylation domain-containing protein [Pseudoalteromonas spongiae]|uniref:prepilin-type N-terminal cleavage/methylation domain-containing protein n=1 Tax=Pseudoalteromonas spongiae TaxID=298657 RepID=UPI000C2CFAF5|nr:prepilin-type N-terminal cleavage/methylation domain-containing protein [Pseudoalteromonas spongiae]